jgi:hypothetical protein
MLAMEIDTRDFDRQLREFAETPALIAKTVRAALAETVDDLHTRELMEMDQVFDKPTPYVKRGLKKRYPGQAGVLHAGIHFEEWPIGKSPADIIAPHVFGGQRRLKKSERRLQSFGVAPAGSWTVMSSGYPKNQYGNIAGARYTQMLNEVGALLDTAARGTNTKRKSSAEKRAARGWQFFLYTPKGAQFPVGIAEKRGKTGMKMMLSFTRQPNYRKRFNYFEVAQKQIAYSLPLHFNRIMNRYASRL